MIKWFQSILPEQKIANLNTDWSDGQCLMALVKFVKPDVGASMRLFDPTKRLQNCTKALALAAEHLHIPQLITPEDLSSAQVDDQSMMTYLSYYCEPHKQQLLKWVKQVIPHLRITNFGRDWINGEAFSALISNSFPELLPTLHQQEGGKTIGNTFSLIKQSLGIEVNFTATELAQGEVEELKMMTLIHTMKHKTLSHSKKVTVSGLGLQRAGREIGSKETSTDDPSQCKLIGSIPNNMKLNTPHEMIVNMNGAGKGLLELTCRDHDVSTVFDTKVQRIDGQDSQLIVVTPRVVGSYVLGITSTGVDIPNSPSWVTVVDPSQYSVSYGKYFHHKRFLVGKPIQFQITRTGLEQQLQPEVKATGPRGRYKIDTNTDNGHTYSVHFIPWEIGSHDFSVTCGGFHVSHSPFHVEVQRFNVGSYGAQGAGLQRAFCGVPALFYILTKRPGLVDSGTLVVQIHHKTRPINVRVRIRDDKDGTYKVAYLVDFPGAYLINITADGAHIPGSPFHLTARLGPEPDKCRMWGPALQPDTLLAIGEPIDFMVNTAEAGTGTLTVKAVGPNGSQARVYLARPQDESGVYNIKLDPPRRGKYRLSVKWSGQHIPGSPRILKIYSGTDATKCRVYGPGLEDGLVGRPSLFVIETRDAGAGTLKVRLRGVKNSFKVELTPKDGDHRTLHARYNLPKPGDYLITITWNGKNIPGETKWAFLSSLFLP